jgi:arginyl-tRNA synthetase
VSVRIDRLLLAEAVGDLLLQVFNILGIQPIDKM